MLDQRKPQGFNQITPYIMAITAIGYFIIGFFVIKRQWLMVPLNEIVSYALGILLIAYGIFRAWRAYTVFKGNA